MNEVEYSIKHHLSTKTNPHEHKWKSCVQT